MKISLKALATAFLAVAKDLQPEDLDALVEATALVLEKQGQKRLLHSLPRAIEDAYNAAHNIVPVTFTLPSGDVSDVAHLTTLLENTLGKTISVRTRTDESLIGGALVAVSDERFDISLKTALHEAVSQFSVA